MGGDTSMIYARTRKSGLPLLLNTHEYWSTLFGGDRSARHPEKIRTMMASLICYGMAYGSEAFVLLMQVQ
jgi:hypothetical protein